MTPDMDPTHVRDDKSRQPHVVLDAPSRVLKAKKIIEIVGAERFARARRILEIGCGSGVIAHTLAELGGPGLEVFAVDVADNRLVHDKVLAYHGVDFSPDFIEVARRKAAAAGIANGTFHCEDIIDFAKAHPGRFGVATALDFSEHIGDEDFIAIFTAVRDAMVPGGRLYIHTPNLTFLPELAKQWGIIPKFPQHIAVRDAAHHVRLLERCGFSSGGIRTEQLAHYNVMRFLHPLRRLPVVGKYFAARLFIECRK